MALSIFKRLNIGEVHPISVTLQLANRIFTYLRKVIEDVLIKVDKFIFPIHFIVLYMKGYKEICLILGKSFLATGKVMIDVQKSELAMRVQD
ncbi:hypothetical protein MA16_Dca012705 [Dendrobium catenatum]|uniref:Uncharacterized protein n=1 Tax=Dendrobium catenatum TaxID=906689 RepID=A0A2I0WPQ2_9ASPA|nr:hypothetical protein MA16_Dca012705 [Dendrobium catenatum]